MGVLLGIGRISVLFRTLGIANGVISWKSESFFSLGWVGGSSSDIMGVLLGIGRISVLFRTLGIVNGVIT